MCQKNSCWKSFPPLVSPQFWSEIGLDFSHNYPSLFKIKISIDQGMAAVPMSLARSSGSSEAQTCDNGTETQEVTKNTQRFCSLRPFSHILSLDSEQLSLPNAL